MNKQMLQISKIAAWSFVYALVIGFILLPDIIAQTKQPTPKPKTIYWYMDYTVTVKGEGRDEGDASNDRTIVWKVDRTYSGSQILNRREVDLGTDPAIHSNPQKIMEAHKAQNKLLYTVRAIERIQMHVEINDLYEVITEEKCTDNTDQQTLDIKIWKTDKNYDGLFSVGLYTDTKLLTYNVFIPVGMMSGRSVKLFNQIKYVRTKNIAPSKKNTELMLTEDEMPELPNVEGLIFNHAVVAHKPDQPFPANFSTGINYDSGNMQPDKPIFASVPESKTDVKIRVRYRFSKVPIY